MLFKNNFYQILSSSQEDETYTFSIQLNADHAIFKGHFPGNPVTPGVVQIEMIKELTIEATGAKIGLKTMGNCKFLAILNPETDAHVDVILKISTGEENEVKVNAVIQNSSAIYLKMGATYLPA